MKFKIINRTVIIFGLLVLITGLVLYFAHPFLHTHHAAKVAWKWCHIVFAFVLTVAVIYHIAINGWWLHTLKQKLSGQRMLWQRVFTSSVFLWFLAALITGVCILFDWHPRHSHIWTWHFALGLVWAAFAVAHALVFVRRKPIKS